ncbi:hypothetical protein FEZ18_08170 [Oceanihabitans sp. IOP_32]|uniref:hypothetical protein n=1 Tax=Oceanihabitans sp. IOP_32 TaxID=2529032 RepID=UPI0012934417|nr:hypothetical protein [Oceanihabitans sp. IOP_32]QFZ54774.1 hypothetical protein FEZ18_08170 [Oceanihabitans sp. IOP_32]
MKTLNNNIVIVTLLLFASPVFFAQNAIQGDIENWTHGEVLLLFSDFISREEITMGSISAQGKITIDLDDDFLEQQKKAAEKAKAKAPKGWKMKFNTVATSFACNAEGVVCENDSIVLSGLPQLEAVSKYGPSTYGYLYSTNKAQLSSWLFHYSQVDAVKGYYLRWFFAEDKASVKGLYSIPTYTGNEDENYINTTVYNLELQKGWNIIKYEITETFTSQTGKVAASKTEVTKIDEVPEDAQWFLVSE